MSRRKKFYMGIATAFWVVCCVCVTILTLSAATLGTDGSILGTAFTSITNADKIQKIEYHTDSGSETKGGNAIVSAKSDGSGILAKITNASLTTGSGCSAETSYESATLTLSFYATEGETIKIINVNATSEQAVTPNVVTEQATDTAPAKVTITTQSGYNGQQEIDITFSIEVVQGREIVFVPSWNDYCSAMVEYNSTQVTIDSKNTVEAGDIKSFKPIAETSLAGLKFDGWSIKSESGTVDRLEVGADGNVSLEEYGVGTWYVSPMFHEEGNKPYAIKDTSDEYYYLDEALTAAVNSTSKIVIVKEDAQVALMNGKDCVVPSGVTLLVPYNSSNTVCTTTPVYNDTTAEPTPTPTIYRTLTFGRGIKLTVNGAISLPAQMVGVQPTFSNGSPYGEISHVHMEDGSSIIVNGGGNLYCWGVISGNGSVTMEPGSRIYQNFQITDFRGGKASNAMKTNSQKVFPLSQYYFQNVEVPLTIKAGARMTVNTAMTMTGGMQKPSLTFIGDSSDGLFRINSGSITLDYQEATDRMNIVIEGNVTFASETLIFSYLFSSVELDTAIFVMPINSNISMFVRNESVVDVTEDLALLPGCEVVVDKGGVVKATNGAQVIVYDLDNWGPYVMSASKMRPIRWTYANGTAAIRTEADLTDALVCVNGTLDLTNGELYTTSKGANIHSTGSGVIIMKAGTTTTTHQATYNGNVGYTDIPITSAQLKNRDGSFQSTSDSSSVDTYSYCGVLGKWAVGEHSDTITTVDATCTTAGKKTISCSAGTYELTLPALGHKEIVDPAVAPSCTGIGVTAGKHCSVCGLVTQQQTVIPAKGHTETTLAGKAATCTETGLTEGKKCSVCGTITVAQTEIPLADHTEEAIPGKAATCTETGLTEGKQCSVCKKVLQEQEEIPAKGHSYGDWVQTKAPTCVEEGEERRDCSNCDAYETQSVATVSHSYTSVVTPPTCTEKGYTTYTCSCGDTYVDNYVDAKGHSYTSKVTAPTCTEKGYTTYTCSCGDTYVDNYVDATGHNWVVSAAEGSNERIANCKNGCEKSITLNVAYRLDDYLWFNGYIENLDITSVDGVQKVNVGKKAYLLKAIPAKEIPDDLDFTVTFTMDGASYSCKFTVNLEDYNAAGKEALKQALLTYGDAAKDYFGGTEVGEQTKPSDLKNTLDVKKPQAVEQTMGDLSISTSGATIYFDEAIRLSVKYQLNGIESTTVKIGEDTYTVVQVGVLLNEMGFADDNLTWKWDGKTLTTANSMACLTFSVPEITAPEGYLPNQPDVPADPDNPSLKLPGDTMVNEFAVSGEATFNLTAEQYLKGFSLRAFAVLQDAEGDYHCIYGKQYGYGLEAYIDRTFGTNGNAFDKLLIETWNLAQVAG